MSPFGLAKAIDHTLLKPDATRDQIERHVAEAIEVGCAAVCVNPVWVADVADRLRGTGVAVCTVVGFPLGASASAIKAAEAMRALEDGATEIDMVLQIGALKAGDLMMVAHDIEAVTTVVRRGCGLTKVILETALLGTEEQRVACRLAMEAGAQFVKTSTGFGPSGATVADVKRLVEAVGGRMGVKASGGIRNLATAREMMAAGASRIGTSSGLAILAELRAESSSVPHAR
jgi:deoxyribose-phosphate aldolase